MWVILVAIALLLLALNIREHYVEYQDKEKKVPSVTVPGPTAVWRSKIEAESPVGANEDDYIPALKAFYDKVYTPAAMKPTLAQVDAFVKGPDGSGPGIDTGALKKIIVSGFYIDVQKALEETKADAVEKAKKDLAAGFIEPKDGVDQVRSRTENEYVPADMRPGELPEGVYTPTTQMENPRRPGEHDDNSASWSSTQFYGVCECAKNVL